MTDVAILNGHNIKDATARAELLNKQDILTAGTGIDITNNTVSNLVSPLVPSQASASNKLADKNFVNSSISTNTANFIGTFNSVADLEAYSGTVTNNDYAFVVGTDAAGNTVYNRYKYTTATTPASWVFEYALNNSSFTSDQWAAINSGATTTNIGQIATNTNDITTINSTISGYGDVVTHDASDFATAAQGILANTAVQPGDLSTVATTGNYNDLSNKPTIPAAQVNSDWNASSGVAQILNKPTLGTMATESASDYTPTSGLATVATTGAYSDLSGTPTIPTVNNATLTIQKNSVGVATFTANASSNVTANITVPTKISDLTNDSNFANQDLSNLTSTGANIGNWSSNVTNCITEIPQDVTVSLSDGTLTLAKDSKCYKADGTTIIASTNVTKTYTTNGSWFLVLENSNYISQINANSVTASNTEPVSPSNNDGWWDTANNKLYKYSGAWVEEPLPFALVTVSGGAISSIDKVFNGIGYIGSTVFVLPGVKGLIPNGRNSDGTLNNKTSYNSTTVKTITPTNGARYICLSPYSVYADTPLATDFYYDETKNMNFRTTDGVQREYVVCGIFTQTNSGITNFSVKTAFHAVDYSDSEYIAHCAMPSGKKIDLTASLTDGYILKAPVDGYVYLGKYSSASGQRIRLQNTSSGIAVSCWSSGVQNLECIIAVSKGQNVRAAYSADGSTNGFFFVYSNGAK